MNTSPAADCDDSAIEQLHEPGEHPIQTETFFRPSPDDLKMNAHLLVHPEIDMQQWFEAQV